MKEITRKQIRFNLALLLLIGFFTLLGMMLFVPVPPSNEAVLNVLTGFMGGAFVTMVSFYFGDSEGNDREGV